MSKETTPKVETTTVTAWYKSAVLPWAIIVIVSVGFAGIVVGWNARSEDISRVKQEASVLVQDLKAEDSKTVEQQ